MAQDHHTSSPSGVAFGAVLEVHLRPLLCPIRETCTCRFAVEWSASPVRHRPAPLTPLPSTTASHAGIAPTASRGGQLGLSSLLRCPSTLGQIC